MTNNFYYSTVFLQTFFFLMIYVFERQSNRDEGWEREIKREISIFHLLVYSLNA